MRKAKTAEDWHRARLAAKNLRYAMELALPALPRQRRLQLALKRLVGLQQQLGDEHDQAIAGSIAHQIAGAARISPEASLRATALIEGWSARAATPIAELHERARRTQRRLEKAFGALKTFSG